MLKYFYLDKWHGIIVGMDLILTQISTIFPMIFIERDDTYDIS